MMGQKVRTDSNIPPDDDALRGRKAEPGHQPWHMYVVAASGSNQYVKRARSGPAPPQPDLLTAAAASTIPQDPGQLRGYINWLEAQLAAAREQLSETSQVICGELYDTKCTRTVGPPDWSHDNHPSPRSRRLAAGDRRTPPEVLERLLKDNTDWLVLHGVLRNKSCPPSVLRYLGEKPNTSANVLELVAAHSNCPSDILNALVGQRLSLGVRMKALCNPKCPPEALGPLAKDNDYRVRICVAKHRRCPPETLQELLQDRDLEVRQAALGNARLPRAARAMYQLAHN